MAVWPPRPCTYRGCPALVHGASRCPEHPYPPRVYDGQAREYDRERGSKQARGYGGAWERVREAHLKRQSLCQHCLLDGRVTQAEMVDHIHEIKDGGPRFKSSNLQSLCYSCHRRKTEAVKAERQSKASASQAAQDAPGSTGTKGAPEGS